ncbi:hypothetical protein ACPW96_10120 [Micromonospora sp. DT81.3]
MAPRLAQTGAPLAPVIEAAAERLRELELRRLLEGGPRRSSIEGRADGAE